MVFDCLVVRDGAWTAGGGGSNINDVGAYLRGN